MNDINTSDVYRIEQQNHIIDPFWGDDWSVLFDSNRAIEFFPTKDMAESEKLNALSRFFIYLGVLLFLIYHNYMVLFIPIVALIILWIIDHNAQIQHFEDLGHLHDQIKQKLNIDPKTPIKIATNGDICQMPTPTNPFGNVLLTDYTNNPHRPPACQQSDPETRDLTNRYFNYNLYMNLDDVWEKCNSQRQYVTQPSTTIPNDRDSFMKWCWKTTYVCKDGDVEQCLELDDLRRPGVQGFK